MVSFVQLIQFTNLQMNRSYLKKRVGGLEGAADDLLARVIELERWRAEHTESNLKDFDQTWADQKLTNQKLEAFYKKYQEYNLNNQQHQLKQDNEINEILMRLEVNKEEHDEIGMRIDQSADQAALALADASQKLENKMANAVKRMQSRIEDNMAKLGQLQKDMDATRVDIFDKVSQSMESMQTGLAKETERLRTDYDSMTAHLRSRAQK